MSSPSCCETSAPSAPPTGSTELAVSGLNCNNCARKVTNALQAVAGVHSVAVDLETRRASVRWAAHTTVHPSALLAALKAAGYDAQLLVSSTRDAGARHQRDWHLSLWLGVAVTLPLMLGEWVFGVAMERWFQWLSFALAGVVQIFAGAQFYRGAWRQLKVGSSSMDTLVALGSTTAFGYSAWALLSGHGGHVYFMEAAAIITLISVGHWLEARVSVRASHALKSLLQLAPETARRIGAPDSSPARADLEIGAPAAHGAETEVSVSELKPGDRIALRPGDRVPVDGVVQDGESAVDEAMLTGESAPVDKKPGSELYAGTINLNGRLVMRVTATGEATALAHIIAAVQRAQTSRANIQRLGDRVSNVFVPIVVALALAAGLWWGLAPASAQQVHAWVGQFLWPAHMPTGAAAAFFIAAAVLIIACPCAMGLATPAAIMASANAAAARGILIRDGVALEKAGQVTAVIFDKTGTLTFGKPEVAAVWKNERRRTGVSSVSDSQSDNQGVNMNLETGETSVLRLAAALARHSTHPISQAIAKAERAEIAVEAWQETRGAGVEANVQHATANAQHRTAKARLGSLRWLGECGVALAAGESFADEWTAQGATVVGLAADNSLLGLFAVKDVVKPGAAHVVRQLQQQGLHVHLLTGDNARTAASLAQQVGIAAEDVFAEVRSEQKAEFVKKLQDAGAGVAFVGDGINDAPALEQADLGIAVSRASDVAREAADIILLTSEIEAVPEALGLARATLRTIKQNLFWAFFYNVLGVPLAALGFMSPVLCAAAMGVSDLVVIGNALRLRRWRM